MRLHVCFKRWASPGTSCRRRLPHLISDIPEIRRRHYLWSCAGRNKILVINQRKITPFPNLWHLRAPGLDLVNVCMNKTTPAQW